MDWTSGVSVVGCRVLHQQIELCDQFYRASNIYGLHRVGQSTSDWCHVQGHVQRDGNWIQSGGPQVRERSGNHRDTWHLSAGSEQFTLHSCHFHLHYCFAFGHCFSIDTTSCRTDVIAQGRFSRSRLKKSSSVLPLGIFNPERWSGAFSWY